MGSGTGPSTITVVGERAQVRGQPSGGGWRVPVLKEVARGGDTDVTAEAWGEPSKVTERVTGTGEGFIS